MVLVRLKEITMIGFHFNIYTRRRQMKLEAHAIKVWDGIYIAWLQLWVIEFQVELLYD